METELAWDRARRRLGSRGIELFFEALGQIGRLHPSHLKPARAGIEVIRDLPYASTGLSDHTLDVLRAIDSERSPRPGSVLRPVVLYVHGGGFRILSKDSHWMVGHIFARHGFVVFNINYRHAPGAPFPGALEDTLRAYAWVLERAASFGGDPNRIVVAGESAGANLVTALAVASCFPRPEPFARKHFESGSVPSAVVAGCGLYIVTRERRREYDRGLHWLVRDRLATISEGYLPGATLDQGSRELADVLTVLEGDQEPARGLPPFLLSAGTADPIVEDTRQLERALKRRQVPTEAWYFEGEAHAFQTLWFRPSAKAYWRRTIEALAPLLETNGQPNGQTDGQTDGETDGDTDGVRTRPQPIDSGDRWG